MSAAAVDDRAGGQEHGVGCLNHFASRELGVLNDETISALEPFFDWIGPRNDELDRVISRLHLTRFDPAEYEDKTSKRRRVRTVLAATIESDPATGRELVSQLIMLIRAKDGFQPGSEHYPGDDAVTRLKSAFARAGFELTDDGELRAAVLDGLEGRELSAALRAYVERARAGSSDAALLVGTSKDLVEATAKHILTEGGHDAGPHRSFPKVLEEAFRSLGLAPANWQDSNARRALLNASTPWDRVVQALHVLGMEINSLRNAQGTGHGRATLPELTELQSRVTAEAAAVVASLLLLSLDDQADGA